MKEHVKRLMLNLMNNLDSTDLINVAILAYHKYIEREIYELHNDKLSEFNKEVVAGTDYIILYCLDTLKSVSKDSLTEHGRNSIDSMYKDLSMSVLLDVKKEMNKKADTLDSEEFKKAQTALETFEKDVLEGISGIIERLEQGEKTKEGD